MENKEKIIKALKDVLVLTRAGEGILQEGLCGNFRGFL